ncbi:meiotic recombination protein REC114 [Suncus etruscus]|uniref:meiotic recombination protein REC114 n=1 Tax=Suncus etruscus TaxID=109475 RepID=UPI00210F5FD1|nr:meiotic recombination protein REC114 [Suncus etruscus]
MAEAGKGQVHLGLPEEASTQWPLQRYGRFMLSDVGEQLGPDAETEAASAPTWKVFDSNEESGYLVLTIVISGHFFISQGKTLLEGFSLVGSQNWLKIVRRMDCLLFGTTIKNKSRMFRVQFSGESRAQALEHCCSCVQNLAQYTVVQEPDGINKEAWRSPGPLRAGEGPGKDCVQKEGLQPGSHASQSKEVVCLTSSMKPPEGRTSVAWLAESFLASEELPSVYTEQSAWNVEDIGPFLRLCLMDQNFPAFVEEVEKELKKLAGFKI